MDSSEADYARMASMLDVPFAFRERPIPLPGDMRILWRVATMALLLDRCRGQRCSLPQLHVLNWAIRSAATRSVFLRVLRGERDPSDAIVRVDPTLNQTLSVARAQGLVEWTHANRMKLTTAGVAFARTINEAVILDDVKAFISQLPNKITQRQITQLIDWTPD